MSKKEKAKELFTKGYNCAQSVFGAFCEDFGMSAETALRVSAGLGGGVGRQREVCGAVSGMALVLSLKCGGYAPEDREAKANLYKMIQECSAEFKKQNGSIVCRELLDGADFSHIPQARTPEYYKKRPCVELVGMAAEILENYLKD